MVCNDGKQSPDTHAAQSAAVWNCNARRMDCRLPGTPVSHLYDKSSGCKSPLLAARAAQVAALPGEPQTLSSTALSLPPAQTTRFSNAGHEFNRCQRLKHIRPPLLGTYLGQLPDCMQGVRKFLNDVIPCKSLARCIQKRTLSEDDHKVLGMQIYVSAAPCAQCGWEGGRNG